ncbi:YggT family protein [Phycicoccus sp. BSK3Z-2]|uniref:YggT family protein n=1 Tax=Phycicoccus avicenniae TaxID=2828860 RepID=A0A941I0Z8_9MICO|nr:YggT family protein [Phycicoccus avicenniae]MBR7744425.1 YggT family protein [Phycicoccus avicenniae]
MQLIFGLLAFVVFLYLVVLIGRLVFDWIRMFARDWRPRGPVLLVAEPVYTLTDPPLNALRRVIPPLRLGGISLDLSFIVLFLAVVILRSVFTGLAQ